jgi:hypothetical protein
MIQPVAQCYTTDLCVSSVSIYFNKRLNFLWVIYLWVVFVLL